MDGTDRRTDGRTPDSCIDSAAQSAYVPVRTQGTEFANYRTTSYHHHRLFNDFFWVNLDFGLVDSPGVLLPRVFRKQNP